MLGAVAAAQNDSNTTAPAAVLDRGLPSWLGEIAVRKPTLEGAIAFIKELEEKFASLSPGEPGPIRLLQ